MNRICVIVATTVLASALGMTRVEVFHPERKTHPALAELAAERNAAAAAGDLALARSVELRIQAKLQELHPLPRPKRSGARVELGGGRAFESLDPDVLIDTCRILSTAADYELDGAMYAAGHRMGDTTTQIYKSRDHGVSWERIGGFLSSPARLQEKTGLVVGEGDSTFVYGFLIDPDNNGDLYCIRFDTAGHSAWSIPVLAGPDTVTDFAVCRDYSGGDYWLYASVCNEQGSQGAPNDYLLRSTDYGMSWAIVETTFGIYDPHLAASAGTWLYHTSHCGPGATSTMLMEANAYYMAPDSFVWRTYFLPLDTLETADPVAATSFETPVDDASLWMMYSYKRTSAGNWDIRYFWSDSLTWPNWSDSMTLAGDPSVNERFPDLRSYTFQGSPWMNTTYIAEESQFRAVKRTYANSGDPSNWAAPVTLNETSAGTGSGVRPKLCYSPGGPGTGGGAIFTGAGLLHMYWNAPWMSAVAEEGAELLRGDPTIAQGTFTLPSRHNGVLLDISGRKVVDLGPGRNDLQALPPGVYFFRSAPAAVTKVVITR